MLLVYSTLASTTEIVEFLNTNYPERDFKFVNKVTDAEIIFTTWQYQIDNWKKSPLLKNKKMFIMTWGKEHSITIKES